jgi:predicted nucleic acid-binding protein
VTTKAKVTEGGAADTQGGDRTLGESSEEVEIFEEPGRLVVAIARKAGERAPARIPSEEGPILGLGKNPGRTGAGDGSAEHDRYIYTVIDREAGAFLNTGYLVAIENAEDDNHPTAREHFDGFGRMSMVTTTSYILDEVVTFFNVRGQHAKVVEVEEWLHGSPSVGMVHVGEDLLRRALGLLRDVHDKGYSLTDCVSFVLMRERGISVTFAFDRNFEQEGFVREPYGR